MVLAKADLSNCDLEPIHIPGKIQSHGFLVAVDKDQIIRFLSVNTKQFFNENAAALLGEPLAVMEQLLQPQKPGLLTGIPVDDDLLKINIGQKLFNVIVSNAYGYRVFEFEPAAGYITQDVQRMIRRSIPAILGGRDLHTLLSFATEEVKKIIGFDRVMIYRFAEDGHGEVVSEAKNENLQPWLGLHYPASDIPRQARELYKINLTRLIADVAAEDAGILSSAIEKNTLDLTYAQLRAVSPVHIQYLKNMGVASSFSISLLYRGELWGLIACHNYTPHFIDYECRDAAKMVGQIVSSALEFRQDEENQQLKEIFQEKVNELSRHLYSNISIEEALIRPGTNLMDVVHATGAVLVYDKKISVIGEVPPSNQLETLVKWLQEKHKEPIFFSNALSGIYAPGSGFQEVASGILFISLSKELGECVIWFKPERITEVRWAGDPDKPAEILPNGMTHISPRHSFETWTKEVSGTSQAWAQEEIKSALRFREELLGAINVKATALRTMNDRLQQAYDELDTFSYTISHDLKMPISAIRGYVQLLEADATMPAMSIHMLQRIRTRTDKMEMMIKEVLDYSRIGRLNVHYQSINIREIITEIVEDLRQGSKNILNIRIGDTPAFKGDPVMIWQVFSNLMGNAIKYSQHVNPIEVHINGKLTETKIIYSIKDNGIGIPEKDLDNIFTLFSRMDNVQNIEGTGVGLAIVKKIVEKHKGSIWAENDPGGGSTFFLSFNRY